MKRKKVLKKSAKPAVKSQATSPKKKTSTTKLGQLFSGIKVIKTTDPVEVYACTPFSDTSGSCGTCYGSYTC